MAGLLIGGQQYGVQSEQQMNRIRYCSIFNSAPVSLATATLVPLTADSEVEDVDGMHSTSSNTERIVCVYPGIYVVTASVLWAVNATGQREINLSHSAIGVFWYQMTAAVSPSTDGNNAQTVMTNVRMAVGDYVFVQGRQNSGGNLNATLQNFAVAWIGP